MQIKKEIPSWYIISDSKINQNTIQRYMTESNIDDYEQKWIKNNGKALQVSGMEKTLEFLAEEFLDIKNTEGLACQSFIQTNFNQLVPLFNHFHMSVLFKNVSHKFLTDILLAKFDHIHINKKEGSDLSLWLPPVCESHQKLQHHFGYYAGEVVKKIDELLEAGKQQNADPKKLIQTALSLMPMAQQCKIIVTGSILTWRDILLKLTSFESEDETKYILMNLSRDFKMRYFSFFQDIVAEDVNGQQMGLDSIAANDLMWNNLKLTLRN